jgi:K(+)-stimulated pyrophosphate-energized sodium pump
MIGWLAQESGPIEAHFGSAEARALWLIFGVSLVALLFAWYLVREVLAAPEGTEKMKEIAKAIQEGARAYLNRQYRTLGVFLAIIAVLLFFVLPVPKNAEHSAISIRLGRSIAFLLGALASMTTGYVGMWLAVRANVRTANAARETGLRRAMRIAFRAGGVAGMFTVGLGLFGATLILIIYKGDATSVLVGFGFGGALLAMFMRVGGGIFTKAADVGADLVGKVEQGIPEDDPRNAATIADNVGDNVGDCAGMAADLFESYAVMLVAALILGAAAFGQHGLLFPLIVPAIGVLTAIIGVYITRAKEGEGGLTTINRSFYISAAISAVLCVIAAFTYLPATFGALINPTDPTVVAGMGNANPQVIASVAVIIGIVLAGIILWLTGYFTGTEHKPVKTVGESSLTGAATVILSGISIGFESAVYTALVIAAAVFGAFTLATGSITVALFAVALAGTGLLTTVGVIAAMDTFGPVSDNAQGIAEMSGDVEGAGVGILTELDAVGNTTKAITKGIAIATAVLAATALFGSYRDAITTAIGNTDISAVPSFNYQVFTPSTLVGVIIGASVVFMFSGLAINAVTRAAGAIVFEVRRQFRENPGIMEGTVRPEYGRVVDICTRDSLRELATPGLLAIFAPIAVGFGLGVGPLAGYLAGAIATGTLMAIFLANSGGAWDNGKKLVEDGNFGGKGSDAHAATVIGDTVGDPFKDTAGPAINPLIKVMNLVSLLIATSVVKYSHNGALRTGVAIVAVAIVVGAVIVSKRRSTSIASSGPGGADTSGTAGASDGPAAAGEEGKASAGTAAA